MGTYLRKSFTIGPIRLNLSKSGIGMSFGVTGLRLGTGPRGPYIHAGRGGLYFRKSLNTKPAKNIEDIEQGEQDEIENVQQEVVPEDTKGKFLYYLKKIFILIVNILFWAIIIYFIIAILFIYFFISILKYSTQNTRSSYKHKRGRK